MNFIDREALMLAAEAVRAEAPPPVLVAPPGQPRADFECRHCEATYEDLPTGSTRCPVCGFKRGFRRLFNRIGVSTKGHRAAQFIDPRMTAMFDEHTSRKASAKRFEVAAVESEARAWDAASPEDRSVVAATKQPGGPIRSSPAGAALGMIPSAARADSRAYTMPLIQSKRVAPTWATRRWDPPRG